MDRSNTIFSARLGSARLGSARLGGIYRVKAQGRTALLSAYLKLNTQLMDNRRAKGEFCPLVRRFSAFMDKLSNDRG